MKDSMFVETEQAQALREIRSRYPGFDMVQFVRTLKWDVPVVIKAYLESDLEALNEHCAPEMMERFSGIVAAQKAEVLPAVCGSPQVQALACATSTVFLS